MTTIIAKQPAAPFSQVQAAPKLAPANQRSPKDYRKARNHTKLVTLLKGALPIAAVLLTAFFVLSAYISIPNVENVSVEKVGLNDGKLVMNKPIMTGFDKNNRPYNVRADKAIQDLKIPGIIELETIDAELPMDTKNMAHINADSGTYNSNDETMVLRNNVKIKGARGMDITMEEAMINIKTGSMNTDKPVTVISGETDITADTMRVEDNGKRIIFEKRVKMIIKKPISRGVKPPANDAAN